jgi:hypothetical protein
MHGITTESSKEVHNGSDSQACNESLEEEIIIIIITNKIIIIYSSLLSTKKMIGQWMALQLNLCLSLSIPFSQTNCKSW